MLQWLQPIERQLVRWENAFGAMGIAKRWPNYSFDAVLIAAGGQSLLRVGKAIFASDQIVETDSP